MTAAEPTVCNLDAIDIHSPEVELAAATMLRCRLGRSGAAPYSLCEVRVTPAEYAWLLRWADAAPPNVFRNESDYRRTAAGLVLLTLLSEWNRRESDGGSVFLGASDLVGDGESRASLFQENGNPHIRTRTLIQSAAEYYRLRHAFGRDEKATVRWYLTVQLQYGFSHAQIPRVAEWVRGFQVTEAMQRLIAAAGPQRSRSFQRLLDDLRRHGRGYTSAAEARRLLARSHWVLPEWVPALLEACRSPGSSHPPEPPDGRLFEGLKLRWDPNRGPVVGLRPLPPLGGDGCCPDRYALSANGQALATWWLQPPAVGSARGEYRSGVERVEVFAAAPDLVLRLEDEASAVAAAEVVAVWDAGAEVQVLRVGSEPGAESADWEAGADLVVVTRPDMTPSVAADAWFLTGYGTPLARRWLRYTPAPAALTVTDAAGRLVWEAAAAKQPGWARDLSITTRTGPAPALGGPVGFRVTPAPGSRVEWVVANGVNLGYDPLTDLYGPAESDPLTAVAGHRLRVGLAGGGRRAVVHKVVKTPCRGLAHQAVGDGWRTRDPLRCMLVRDAQRDHFRVFTEQNGPKLLVEGFEVHGRLTTSRPRHLPQVLGTGAALCLAPGPLYAPAAGGQRHQLAASALDAGLVVGGSRPAPWPGLLRLELAHPVEPREGHCVLLWSSRHGLHGVGPDTVTAEGRGRTWAVETPWTDKPEAFLAAVAYEGHRLGFWWFGEWEQFFAAAKHVHPGIGVRQRLALGRWLRLPGLRGSGSDAPHPQRMAREHPAELLAVALFGRGLEGLPGCPVFDGDGLAFDAICRQLLLDAPVTPAAAAAVRDLFAAECPADPRGEMVDQLFPAHPVFAARVARATWRATPTGRAAEKARLRADRLRLVDLPPSATPAAYQAALTKLLASAGENARVAADTFRVREGIVQPALDFALRDQPLSEMARHDLLVALGVGDFRLYLALHLLEQLEARL